MDYIGSQCIPDSVNSFQNGVMLSESIHIDSQVNGSVIICVVTKEKIIFLEYSSLQVNYRHKAISEAFMSQECFLVPMIDVVVFGQTNF